MNPKKNSKKIVRKKDFTIVPDACLKKLQDAKLQGREWNVLMIFIEKTWGWAQEWDWVGLSQIQEATGMLKHHACRIVGQLEKRRIILRDPNRRKVTVAINENYDEWLCDVLPKVVSNQSLPDEASPTTNEGNTETLDEVTTINTSTRNTTTRIAPAPSGGAHALGDNNTDIVTKEEGACAVETEDLQNVNNISKGHNTQTNGNTNNKQHSEREEGEQSPTMAAVVHLICTGRTFPNLGALKRHISVNIRASKGLRFYTPRQIATACVAAMSEGKQLGYGVNHVSTVEKKISYCDAVSKKQSVMDFIDTSVARYEDEEKTILTEQSSLIVPN